MELTSRPSWPDTGLDQDRRARHIRQDRGPRRRASPGMYHEVCLSFLAVTPLFACAGRRSGLRLRRPREVFTAFVPFGGVHGGLWNSGVFFQVCSAFWQDETSSTP